MAIQPRPEEAIFEQAREQANSRERVAFVEQVCGGDEPLKRRVVELLAAHDASQGPLDAPPPGLNATQDSTRERPGMQIGPYKLFQQIGEGGFGIVFLAEQNEPVRRRVALKVIKPGMDTRQVIARFEAERQALAVMDHPNIARVLDAGATESGRPYFVMELVRGIPITQYCDENSLTIRERLELFATVCQAIQHAHTKGIIHRDIKPTNVLVTRQDGEAIVKVIDFGIAKAMGQRLTDKTLFTDFAQMIGTPLYMSPEQAELSSTDIDTRSDIYSLGVLLYELLTGSTPVSKEQLKQAAFDEIRRIIREDEPPKPSTRISSAAVVPSIAAQRHTEAAKLARLVRGELDWIVMKALEKNRSRRYETANGLAADVLRFLNDEAVQACPPSTGYRLRKFARKNKRALATAALLAVMLVAALGVVAGSIGWIVRDQEARRAETAARADSALQDAVRLREQKKWSEARAAAGRADLLLAGGTEHPDLWQRLKDLITDLDMVDRLERIRENQTAAKQGSWDHAAADPAYDAAFRNYGIDLMSLDAAAAAERVRASAIVEHLVPALDDWIWVIPRKNAVRRERIRAVVSLADPDPWRGRFRDPVVRSDQQALEELAGRLEVAALPPTSVVLLGRALVDVRAVPKAVEVLTTAQRHHPEDFWLNMELASILRWRSHPPRYLEAAAYCRAALALRPNSPRVEAGLASSFFPAHLDEAIPHFRRAIQLQRDAVYPGDYHQLGGALATKGAWAEAIASYQECLKGKLTPRLAAMVFFDLAVAYSAVNEPSKALASLRESRNATEEYLEAHAGECQAHYWSAWHLYYCFLQSKRDPKLATGEADALIQACQARAKEVLGKAAQFKDARVFKDALEAETLTVAEGNCPVEMQWMWIWDDKNWSNGWQQLCQSSLSDYVEYELPASPHRVSLAVCFTKAPDYAIVEVAVDGKVVGQPFDGYEPKVVPSGPIEFGVLEMNQGTHKVRFTAIDKNPSSSNYFLGIDCLILKPAK